MPQMTLPLLDESPAIAPQAPDALDHLADVLFPKMGSDGV